MLKRKSPSKVMSKRNKKDKKIVLQLYQSQYLKLLVLSKKKYSKIYNSSLVNKTSFFNYFKQKTNNLNKLKISIENIAMKQILFIVNTQIKRIISSSPIFIYCSKKIYFKRKQKIGNIRKIYQFLAISNF